MRKKLFKKVEPVLYLLPALFFIIFFTYYPFVNTIIKSFFLTNSMGKIREFVGFENFVRIVHNKEFQASVANTFKYVFTSVPFSIIVALVLALISAGNKRLSPVYETMYALPMAMSTSVCAMIFQLIYNPSLGILNAFLGTKISWIKDDRTALYAISFISAWMNTGFNFLFLLAAVRSVPAELIECAEIEGAGFLRKTQKIILPIISPTLFFLIVNSLARAMMMSGLVIILTSGGRQSSASTMISYMYSQAVLAQNYNNGYATAIIAFLITFVLLVISFSFEKRTVNYD